jgi:hypothetical protein
MDLHSTTQYSKYKKLLYIHQALPGNGCLPCRLFYSRAYVVAISQLTHKGSHRGGPGSNPGLVMWDFVMDKSGAGAGFLRELRFPLPIYNPPASPQSCSLSPEAGTIGQEWPQCPVYSIGLHLSIYQFNF